MEYFAIVLLQTCQFISPIPLTGTLKLNARIEATTLIMNSSKTGLLTMTKFMLAAPCYSLVKYEMLNAVKNVFRLMQYVKYRNVDVM